jgi:hypothetical protein
MTVTERWRMRGDRIVVDDDADEDVGDVVVPAVGGHTHASNVTCALTAIHAGRVGVLLVLLVLLWGLSQHTVSRTRATRGVQAAAFHGAPAARASAWRTKGRVVMRLDMGEDTVSCESVLAAAVLVVVVGGEPLTCPWTAVHRRGTPRRCGLLDDDGDGTTTGYQVTSRHTSATETLVVAVVEAVAGLREDASFSSVSGGTTTYNTTDDGDTVIAPRVVVVGSFLSSSCSSGSSSSSSSA